MGIHPQWKKLVDVCRGISAKSKDYWSSVEELWFA
jgi:hypothetical protein